MSGVNETEKRIVSVGKEYDVTTMVPPTLRTFEDAFVAVLKHVADHYEYTNAPRGNASRECLNMSFTLADPINRVPYLASRKVNVVFLFAEALWYLWGRNDLEMISYYAPQMRSYSMDGKTLRGSAYGSRLFRRQPGAECSSFDQILDLIREDSATKRAVMTMFRPEELAVPGNLDVACVIALQFLLRDGKLHAICFMRANDAGQGLLSDVFSFTLLQEFAAHQLKVPVGTYTHHVGSMHIGKKRTKVVLYWRPIVSGWNDQPETMAAVLDAGRTTDAIVFTGYYHKEENAEYLRGLGVKVPYQDDYARRKVLPAEIDEKVIDAWRASGATTALFRKTSCGVSFVHGAPDYNGHWGVNELCDICPEVQRTLCRNTHIPPTDEQLRKVLDRLGYDTPTMVDGGHVWTRGLTEQQRYPIQHALAYQIWDLDLPHFAHAHGRSRAGYHPDAEEEARLAVVREQFTTQARFDDD